MAGSLVINGVTVEPVEADSLQDISKIDAAGAGVVVEVIDTVSAYPLEPVALK